MKNMTLLAIDDDDLILQSLKIGLPKHWRVEAVNEIKNVPKKGEFTAALVDMHLTNNLDYAEGPDVIKTLKENMPHLEIIAMSGDLDRDLMERCLRAGASRYISKPLNLPELVLLLDKIEALVLLQKASFRHPDSTFRWVGNSTKSQEIKRQLANLKGEIGPILIDGESGTGKEVAANLIHQQESERPFIAVNVAAIPENLFESEIFGHVRGAFTGADQNKMGLAEAANGGDLFLDEVETLSLTHQAKLLRLLESGEVRRVGAKENIKVNTRVIVATNKDLSQMVREGQFREDLLWRINSKKIILPPLRERLEDIDELSMFFLSRDKNRTKKIDDEALREMKLYDWPGNVRELKRVCEQLLITSPLPIIRKEDIQKITSPKFSGGPGLKQIDFTIGLENILNQFESSVLEQALRQFGDVEEVSRILKVSRSNLYKKIKDLNIDWRPQ